MGTTIDTTRLTDTMNELLRRCSEDGTPPETRVLIEQAAVISAELVEQYLRYQAYIDEQNAIWIASLPDDPDA